MKAILVFNIFFIINASCVFSQVHKINGVLNTLSTDKSFGEGQESIKASILDSLANLNLFEYAHSLNELFELIHTGEVTINMWNNYTDMLLNEVIQEKQDTIRPFYAVDYKGIIPLQAEFFISSLEINTQLKDVYPREFEVLKNSTSKLIGKGYSWEAIDTLLVLFPKNSTVGTVNFWLFLEIYGCDIMELGIMKEGEARVKMLLENLEILSTYKTPLKLQSRKARVLNSRIDICLNNRNFKLNANVIVMDNEKNYYEQYLKEGLNLDKMKEF